MRETLHGPAGEFSPQQFRAKYGRVPAGAGVRRYEGASLGMIDVAYIDPRGARPDYTELWGADELEFPESLRRPALHSADRARSLLSRLDGELHAEHAGGRRRAHGVP